MTEAEVLNMERALGIALPEIYREWAKRLSPCYSQRAEDHGVEPDDHWSYGCNDAESLIETNLRLRAMEWGGGWPNELFCFDDANGNFHFFDVKDLGKGVFYSDHDAGPYYESDDYSDCFLKGFEEYFLDGDWWESGAAS